MLTLGDLSAAQDVDTVNGTDVAFAHPIFGMRLCVGDDAFAEDAANEFFGLRRPERFGEHLYNTPFLMSSTQKLSL